MTVSAWAVPGSIADAAASAMAPDAADEQPAAAASAVAGAGASFMCVLPPREGRQGGQAA